MEVATPTLAEQLAVPLLMLIFTSVVALIGFLLSSKLTATERALEEMEDRLRSLEMDVLKIKVHLKLVRPSDLFKTVTPPSPGESA